MKVVLGRFGGRAEKISLKLGEIQVLFFIFFIFLFSFEYFIIFNQDLFGITPEMKSQAAAIAKHGFEALVTLNKSVGDEKFLEQLNKRLLYYDAMY